VAVELSCRFEKSNLHEKKFFDKNQNQNKKIIKFGKDA
jgi:hypothetical protein